MNRTDCEIEKFSSRTVGFFTLPFALILGFLGSLIVPLVGLVFSIPILLLSLTLIAAPQSKACKLLLKGDS